MKTGKILGIFGGIAAAAIALGVALSVLLVPTPVETARGQGWIDDPAAVAAANVQPFADTPAARAVLNVGIDHAYLWDFHVAVTGVPAVPHDQADVGSCVSFGASRATERTLAAELALGLINGGYVDVVEEVIYGGSRVEIGGGRIRGDGSVGAWAAKWLIQYGVVPRGIHGGRDLSRYSTALCREFGRTGVPAELETLARQFPVKDAANIASWAEAKKALSQCYGIFVCSNVGYNKQRNANGVCTPGPTWYHCMCLDGWHRDAATGKEYGHIENSWGSSYHTGPVGWGNPHTGGFWAESSVIDKMLRQGDSFAVSGATGFPSRKINWFAKRIDKGNAGVFALAH